MHYLSLCVLFLFLSYFLSFPPDIQEAVKKQRFREGKRPDLQRYQPGGGQPRRHKDSAEGEAQAVSTERAHTSGESVPDPDAKMTGISPPSSDLKLTSRGCMSPCDSATEPSVYRHTEKDTFKDSQVSMTDTPESPKVLRKTRKPDREIYQPGGRRTQSSRDSGSNKEFERGPKAEVKGEGEDGGKQKLIGLVEQSKDVHVEDVKEKEEKGKGRKNKESRRKREPGKQQKSSDSPSALNGQTTVQNVTGKVEKLKISSPATLESEERKGSKGADDSSRRRKPSGEVKWSQGGDGDGDEKKKQRSNRRSRGTRERSSKQASGKREEGEGGEKSTKDTSQLEKSGEQKWDVKGNDVNQDKNLQKHRGNQPRARDGERHRTSEGKDNSKVSSVSKRYSKSDIRRPRNRTYSTSSGSSGTSMDGQGEIEKARTNASVGGRDGGEGLVPRSHENKTEAKAWASGIQPRQRRWTARDMSSTDSFEESESWERDGESRALRDRENMDSKTASRRTASRGNVKGSRGAVGSGRGGILRVSLDKKPNAALGASEDQTKRKNQCPRGRGRGILVLPAHTELSVSPEPGPRLMGGMRGGMGLGRGRGGRGGSTRRLWDPNNPDKKPALASSQQSQHSPLQTSLYLHQGGYGPLHFLDTDDETAGSPPVRQGEHVQSQQAAAMAYYKFQNSDNPYYLSLPASAQSTPQRLPYSYRFQYQIPGSNGMYPSPPMPFYGPYGQGCASTSGTNITPEEAEVQTRGELSKLLRVADNQELQLSNLLSREHLSPEGLDRMAQLR